MHTRTPHSCKSRPHQQRPPLPSHKQRTFLLLSPFVACILLIAAATSTLAQLASPPNYYQATAPAPLSNPAAYTLSYTLPKEVTGGSVGVTRQTAFVPAEFGDALIGDVTNGNIFSTDQVVIPFPDPTGCKWYADPPGAGAQAGYCDPTNVATCLNGPVIPSTFTSDPNVIPTFYQGKVVLVLRSSECDFGAKALYAQQAGATAIIIYSCSSAAPYYCDTRPFSMNANGNPLTISALSIDYDTGNLWSQVLALRLANGSPALPIRISVQGTGPMDLKDYVSLSNFITFGITKVPANDGGGGNARTLQDVVASPTVDPCQKRVRGLWCTGNPGKITTLNVNYGVAGTVPYNSLGALDQLITLNLANTGSDNKFNGSLPEDIGFLANLRTLRIDDNGFSALPESTGNMTQLQLFTFTNNRIGRLPDSTANLPNIQIIKGSNNLIANFPLGLNNNPSIMSLDLSTNNIAVDVANIYMNHIYSLQTLTLSKNRLFGSFWSSSFDYTNLTSLDLSSNQITGSLPNLKANTKLTYLDMSSNAFSGGLPTAWNTLTAVKEIKLSTNSLTLPISVLNSLPVLQRIDLSYNLIAMGDETNVGSFLTHSLPNTIQLINFAHNLIAGPFVAGALSQKSQVTKLFLSYNQITSLPLADLFVFSPVLDTIDISFNALTGALPATAPPSNLGTLRFHGNSRLVSSTGLDLPTWLQTSPQGDVGKANLTDPYVCPVFIGKATSVSVTIDPSYYGYSLCTCDKGSYGVAPLCPYIPATVPSRIIYGNLLGSAITAVDTALGLSGPSFGDGAFGNQRFFQGMDTIWTVGANASSLTSVTTPTTNTSIPVSNTNKTAVTPYSNVIRVDSRSLVVLPLAQLGPVLVIYIRFSLDRNNFNQFTDLIEVYEGDEQLKGERVASFRGTDPDPVNKYGLPLPVGTIAVLSSAASINFRSKSTSGTHFNASYTLAYQCPDGYEPTASAPNHPDIPQTCTPILPVFNIPAAVQGAVFGFSALAFLFILITTLIVFKNKDTSIIRSSSVPFCLSVLLFNMILPIGSFFYALSAERGDFVCHARPWLTAMAMVGALTSLLVKANRIRWIFTNTKLSEMVQTNMDLVKKMSVILGIQFLILVVYSASQHFGQVGPEFVIGKGTANGYMTWQCKSFVSGSSNVFFSIWLTVQFLFVVILLCGGLYIAFAIRNVPAAYNEAGQIANCLFAIFAFSILLVPIQFIVDDNPGALAMVRGVGQSMTAVVICATVFMPKVYAIFTGQADGSTGLTTVGATKSNIGARSSMGNGGGSGGAGGAGAGGRVNLSTANNNNNRSMMPSESNRKAASKPMPATRSSLNTGKGDSAPGAVGGASRIGVGPNANAGRGLLPTPAKGPSAFLPALHPIFAKPDPLPQGQAALAAPTGAFLTVEPGFPAERGEMTWPPHGGLVDPDASWPPVLTYAACIPPTPFKPTSGGMPLGPVPTEAMNNGAYDPFKGVLAGDGQQGNPNQALKDFQVMNSMVYLNQSALPWGKSTIPSPEYVKELEQQNIILWSTQKQLSKILMDEESQKWLKLLQVSLQTVLKLNPIQQLTSKNAAAKFSEEDVARETSHFKQGASSGTAREYLDNLERQNRLLWETQSLVHGIFTSNDSERWAKKCQASVTTTLNLNRIEKLVMKSKDPSSVLTEQPNANPYANAAAIAAAEEAEARQAQQQQGKNVSPAKNAAAPATRTIQRAGKQVIQVNRFIRKPVAVHARSASAAPQTISPDKKSSPAASPAPLSASPVASTTSVGAASPSNNADLPEGLSFIDAHNAVAEHNEAVAHEDVVNQIENRDMNNPSDAASLAHTIAEANYVMGNTPRGGPAEENDIFEIEALPEIKSRRRGGHERKPSSQLPSGLGPMESPEGSAAPEQVYVYAVEDEGHPGVVGEEGAAAPSRRQRSNTIQYDEKEPSLIQPLPAANLPAPRQRRAHAIHTNPANGSPELGSQQPNSYMEESKYNEEGEQQPTPLSLSGSPAASPAPRPRIQTAASKRRAPAGATAEMILRQLAMKGGSSKK